MTVLAASQNASVLDQPGVVAFLVVFGMAVLCYFLFRSMSKHLRRVNQAARDEAEATARAEAGDDDGGTAVPASRNGSDGTR